MNIIGKIFVFAVFVMSLMFMAFAVALYSTHTNWRDEILRTADQVQAGKPLGYKAQLGEARKEREALTAEISRLAAEVAASEAARDQVVAKIQTALELEREKAQAELVKTRLELETATKVVSDLRTEIRGMQGTVDEHVDRAAKLAGELHEKESFLAIANERKGQLEKQVANARLLLQQNGLSVDSLPRDSVPAIDGVVTAVVDDSIELSLGGDDGVQAGHELEVYRNDKYLGRVRVVSVKPDRSVAVVVPQFVRGVIQRGDRVATRLKA
jgi:hypothetical protein